MIFGTWENDMHVSQGVSFCTAPSCQRQLLEVSENNLQDEISRKHFPAMNPTEYMAICASDACPIKIFEKIEILGKIYVVG